MSRVCFCLQKLFFMTIVFLFFVSCEQEVQDDSQPIVSFRVETSTGDTYDAQIDHVNRKIIISDIKDPKAISRVVCDLIKGAKTYPRPTSFIGKWNASQEISVFTENKNTYVYTIIFPDFNATDEDSPSPSATSKYFTKLVFQDEFNNANGIPSETDWELCKKQTSDWCEEMSESYDQAYVQDGNLVLIAEKKGSTYYAGGVQSKFSFTFGLVEVRAKLSRYPNGAFPAIWMMPSKYIYPGWPDCGEIDIMEHIKQDPFVYQTIHTNYTYDLNIKNPPNSQTFVCNFNEYRVYSLEWTSEELTFFVDGKKTFSYPNLNLALENEKMQWPFTKDAAFYLILNMGLGRNDGSSWAGSINDNLLPARMEVDWVRIYQ